MTGTVQRLAAERPPRAVRQDSGMYFLVFRVAVVAFFASLILDSGSGERVGGMTIPTLAGGMATLIAFRRWRIFRDRVVWGAVVLLALWVWVQLVHGASIGGSARFLSVLAMGLAFGGATGGRSFSRFQLQAAVVPGAILAGAFYLGFGYEHIQTGRLYMVGLRANYLGVLFASAVVLLVGLFWLSRNKARRIYLALIPLLLPPLWMTGSRRALFLMILALTIGVAVRSRKRVFIWASASMFVALLVSSGVSILPDFVTKSTTFQKRYVEEFERDYDARTRLFDHGLAAARTRPWSGHGLDAPQSPEWRAENIGIINSWSVAVMTHNGFLDYAIMGGIPLLILFSALYARVVVGVSLKAVTTQDPDERDGLVTALMLGIMFLGDIFTGNILSKMGWWMFGFCLYTLNATNQRNKLRSQTRWSVGSAACRQSRTNEGSETPTL